MIHRLTRSAWTRWVLAFAVLAIGLLSLAKAKGGRPNQFEADIRKFEALDAQSPPAERPVLFVGSSSIRFWDTAKSFPDSNTLNRGFGGSQIADCVHFADRIVIKYKPRVVVFYAGDNDLAAGLEPEQLVADLGQFVGKVHAALPHTPIVVISIKPSIARKKLLDKQRAANRQIAAMAKADPLLVFVGVEAAMLTDDGEPRSDIFVADGLHMNAKGYELWSGLLTPILKKLD
jgi:lysophospholipase L1-like esterase